MMQTYRCVVASGDGAALASIMIVEAAMPKMSVDIDVCERSFDLQTVDGFSPLDPFIGATFHHKYPPFIGRRLMRLSW